MKSRTLASVSTMTLRPARKRETNSLFPVAFLPKYDSPMPDWLRNRSTSARRGV